ncbi:MAG: WYL domain-containing protein [Paenibacillaceae bacterium]|nr:WYL domain-containing protein [Paenibacillaceae bacterium]
MSKADNMLAILWLLRSRKRMTARQLADQLEVHIRTVYRAIDALCIAGVPIVADTGRDGGYSIPESVKLEPLLFDGEEQKALLQAAVMAREAGLASGAALGRAVAKIKRHATPAQEERLLRQERRLEVIPPPSAPALAARLAELEACQEQQVGVSVLYRTGYEEARKRRTIDPYGLVYWNGKWYVVGYCHLRGEIRSFRVDRMSGMERTDRHFERDPQFSARDFLLDSLLPQAGKADDEAWVSVRLRGSAPALDELCGHSLWSRTLVERTANEAYFRMEEQSLYGPFPYQLLYFGSALHILEPEALKQRMIDIASSLLDFYST